MSHPSTHGHLTSGEQAMEQDAYGQAEAIFREAVRVAPDDPQTRFHLALALSSQSKSGEALAEVRRTLELDPQFVPAYVLLSSLHQRRGRFEESIDASRAAIELNPRLVRPYVDIVHAKKVEPSDIELIDRMEQMVIEERRRPGEQIGLHFALGKAYDDLRRFERAMAHFEAANRTAWELVGSNLGYDRDNESRAVDQLIRSFDAEFFRRHAGLGSPSELPVLIVGMIRSGTTLLDSILSRHPQIASAGEQVFWEDESLPLLRGAFRGLIDAGQVSEVADRYRTQLRAVAVKRKRVIDKMPINYLHIGLIHTAFPNARFIHMRRHPVDTCISIFATEFGLEPPRFAFSRANIVHAYRQYERLMDHWRRVIPADRFFEVDYEDVVRRSEEVLPPLVRFLGLEWDESILRRDETYAEIVTPSRWQARQPIYRTSLERWRNYEPWLGEFADLL